jgi:hypothetical protein
VTVLKNSVSNNYAFFLTTQENGPIIVDSDFERAKNKFIDAFSHMLVIRSVMSTKEAREIVRKHINSKYPSSETVIEFSDVKTDTEKLIKKAETKLTEVIEEFAHS